MASKIIQKEKERQEEFLKKSPETYKWSERCQNHKQSLINLKEYMEEKYDCSSGIDEDQYLEDIKELTEMIKRYE